jgi:hypothetical protein
VYRLKIAILWAVTIAYFIQAAVLMVTHDRAQAVILLGYAIANCGLIWSLW